MKSLNYFVLLGLISFLFSCSEKVAGTASETETSISGILVDYKGQPLAKLAIRVEPEVKSEILVEGENFIEEEFTDEKGAFTVKLSDPGVYLLTAKKENLGITQRFEIVKNLDSLTLKPDTLMSLTGFVGEVLSVEGSGIKSKVSVLGTGQSVISDDSGFFKLEGLNNFKYSILIDPIDENFASKSLKLIPSADSVRIYVEKQELVPLIVLDNFEDNDTLGYLRNYTNGSEWWKSATGGMVSYKVVANPVHCSVCENNLNRVFEADVDVVDSLEYPFGLFGINLKRGTNFGPDSAFADFSNLKRLTFYARGSGVLRIQFLTQKAITTFNNNAHFQFEVKLSKAWQQFVILSEDIEKVVFENNDYLWKDYNTQVWGISFVRIEDGVFHLDDISIEGVDLSEFILPKVP